MKINIPQDKSGLAENIVQNWKGRRRLFDQSLINSTRKALEEVGRIYVLERFDDDPFTYQYSNPATFLRTTSVSFDAICDYIINIEIYHYFSKDNQSEAIEIIEKLKSTGPPQDDQSLIVLYLQPNVTHGKITSCCNGYRIRQISPNEMIEIIKKSSS